MASRVGKESKGVGLKRSGPGIGMIVRLQISEAREVVPYEAPRKFGEWNDELGGGPKRNLPNEKESVDTPGSERDETEKEEEKEEEEAEEESGVSEFENSLQAEEAEQGKGLSEYG